MFQRFIPGFQPQLHSNSFRMTWGIEIKLLSVLSLQNCAIVKCVINIMLGRLYVHKYIHMCLFEIFERNLLLREWNKIRWDRIIPIYKYLFTYIPF